MIQGYGPVCAAERGLTGSALDIGHEGPDLLDLLADLTPTRGGTCTNQP